MAKKSGGKIKITLTKSLIGCKKDQIATAKALGLKKIRSVVEKENNAATLGMIDKVKHLVTVEQA